MSPWKSRYSRGSLPRHPTAGQGLLDLFDQLSEAGVFGGVEVLRHGRGVQARELIDDRLVLILARVPGELARQRCEPAQDGWILRVVAPGLGQREFQKVGQIRAVRNDPDLVLVVMEHLGAEAAGRQFAQPMRGHSPTLRVRFCSAGS